MSEEDSRRQGEERGRSTTLPGKNGENGVSGLDRLKQNCDEGELPDIKSEMKDLARQFNEKQQQRVCYNFF